MAAIWSPGPEGEVNFCYIFVIAFGEAGTEKPSCAPENSCQPAYEAQFKSAMDCKMSKMCK
jgi:hypothetical protein